MQNARSTTTTTTTISTDEGIVRVVVIIFSRSDNERGGYRTCTIVYVVPGPRDIRPRRHYRMYIYICVYTVGIEINNARAAHMPGVRIYVGRHVTFVEDTKSNNYYPTDDDDQEGPNRLSLSLSPFISVTSATAPNLAFRVPRRSSCSNNNNRGRCSIRVPRQRDCYYCCSYYVQ